MGSKSLDSERAREHPKRHSRGVATSGSAHRPVLHGHAHRARQVDVAEAQRDRPDIQLLGSCDSPGLLGILNGHFMTVLHHARLWTHNLPITGDPVRSFPSQRNYERVPKARKQLDKFAAKDTMEAWCERVRHMSHVLVACCMSHDARRVSKVTRIFR